MDVICVESVVQFVRGWWHCLVPGVVLLYGTHVYIRDIIYRLPPGPFPLPFIGSSWVIAMQPKGQKFPETITKLAQKYGPLMTMYLGPTRMIALNDAKLVQQVLGEQGRLFSGRLERRLPGLETMGEGIVLANDDIWRRNRRFGLKAMRNFGMGKDVMVTKIQEEVRHLIADLEVCAANGEIFFPRHRIANAVSNVICSFVFGKRFDEHDPVFVDLLSRLDRLLQADNSEIATMTMLPFMKHFRIPRHVRRLHEFHRILVNILQESISEHRTDYDPKNIRDFPDLFIQAEAQGDAMSVDEFGHIMFDMFGAGTETTATALTWTILFLCKFPEVQRKCHEAIDAVIDTNRLPCLKDRSKLVYLDAVFHEALRLATIVPLGLFHSNLDTPQKIGDYDVPPNTLVMYNAYKLQMDPEYWKNPEVFDPERWIGEDGGLLKHSSHFLPFGIGPRICMGESLARVEYFLFLTAILHRFSFELKTPRVSYDDSQQGVVNACPPYKILLKQR